MNTTSDNSSSNAKNPPPWLAAYEQYGLKNDLDVLDGNEVLAAND